MAMRFSSFFPIRLTTPRFSGAFVRRYGQSAGENSGSDTGTRARSTAEEFSRLAAEKAESVSETVKETWEKAKETVCAKDSHMPNDKFKEKVELGKYHKIGT